MTINREDLDKKILIDSDIIYHFVKGNSIHKLSLIFSNNLYILDVVEYEICRSNKYEPIVQGLIGDKTLIKMQFPTNKKPIREEYVRLCSERRGSGESACMAVAKFSTDIIASNNLNDIKQYCIVNDILYLTTIDILCIAYFKGVMDKADIDYFLHLNLTDKIKSKIGYKTLDEYLKINSPVALMFKDTA